MIPQPITYDFIKSMYSQKSYIFREENEYANLFGYRSKEVIADRFNDIIGIAYKDFFGNPQCLVFPGTTKPGLYYLQTELGNVKGTFIMQPGQYPDCWMAGQHNGKYLALIQAGSGVFKGWRDANKNGKLDYNGPTYTDSQGVDGHTTRFDIDVNDVVDKFSSGCQVLRDDHHFEIWLHLGLRTLEVFKISKIGYTLFQEAN